MHPIVSIRNTTRGSLPRVPFEQLAREILGKRYELSLVVCADALARSMNIRYRKKSYKPNVLSFELDTNEGEIFLNIPCAKREAKKAGIKPIDRIAHLYVHGCIHLKGIPHGKQMDALEKKYLVRHGFAAPQ